MVASFDVAVAHLKDRQVSRTGIITPYLISRLVVRSGFLDTYSGKLPACAKPSFRLRDKSGVEGRFKPFLPSTQDFGLD